MPAQGETYIAGTGGAVPAGQPITITIGGVPHQSRAPRFITLAMAAGIVLAGVWAAGRRREDDASASAAERKRLLGKKDRLLNDLVRLEADRRAGRVDDRRYASRREALIASLEQVYGALDSDDVGPDPADRAGLAA